MTSLQANNQNTTLEIEKQGKQELDSWAIKTFAVAGILGAGTGLLAAYLLINNRNKTGIQPTVSAREGVKIAVLLMGVIRSVANLWE